MYISDFDNYMKGNEFVRNINDIYGDEEDEEGQRMMEKRIREQLYEHRKDL